MVQPVFLWRTRHHYAIPLDAHGSAASLSKLASDGEVDDGDDAQGNDVGDDERDGHGDFEARFGDVVGTVGDVNAVEDGCTYRQRSWIEKILERTNDENMIVTERKRTKNKSESRIRQ